MTDTNDMRAKFEAWAKDTYCLEPEKYINGLTYLYDSTEHAFLGYKAGAASVQGQEPVATTVSHQSENTMTWLIEPALPVGTKLYAAPLPQGEQDMTATVNLLDGSVTWSEDSTAPHPQKTITLPDGCVVNPADIAEISVEPAGVVTVQMRNGLGHHALVPLPQGEQCPSSAQPVPETLDLASIISGALFDFMGMLTSQTEETHLSGHHDAIIAVERIEQFAAKRGLTLTEANVHHWHNWLGKPEPDTSTAAMQAKGGAKP